MMPIIYQQPRPNLIGANHKRIAGYLATLTSGILIVGLFFTTTNLIPVSVAPFAWLGLLLPLYALILAPVQKVTAWAILYYFVSLVSLILYDPTALINPEFYRYDGNFLISFLPLLALPLIQYPTKISLEKVLKIFVISSISLSLIPSVIEFLTYGYTMGLFVSTNAFGGFLMALIALSFTWTLNAKRKIGPLLILIVSLLMLVFSTSRGSIMAIFLGILSYLTIRYRYKWVTVAAIAAIVLTQSVILFFTYPVYVENKEASYDLAVESADSTKEANIYIRAYENWPRGFYLFAHSPIFGTGVGSANDMPFILDDSSIVQFNSGTIRSYDSAHAHNTYLHILGEQGIVGFLIFLAMWMSVYRHIFNRNDMLMVRDGLLIMFWSLTFASFTEHRIPSPSNVFPFMIIFVLFHIKNPKWNSYIQSSHSSSVLPASIDEINDFSIRT